MPQVCGYTSIALRCLSRHPLKCSFDSVYLRIIGLFYENQTFGKRYISLKYDPFKQKQRSICNLFWLLCI